MAHKPFRTVCTDSGAPGCASCGASLGGVVTITDGNGRVKKPAYTPEPGTFGTLTGDGCNLIYISD